MCPGGEDVVNTRGQPGESPGGRAIGGPLAIVIEGARVGFEREPRGRKACISVVDHQGAAGGAGDGQGTAAADDGGVRRGGERRRIPDRRRRSRTRRWYRPRSKSAWKPAGGPWGPFRNNPASVANHIRRVDHERDSSIVGCPSIEGHISGTESARDIGFGPANCRRHRPQSHRTNQGWRRPQSSVLLLLPITVSVPSPVTASSITRVLW